MCIIESNKLVNLPKENINCISTKKKNYFQGEYTGLVYLRFITIQMVITVFIIIPVKAELYSVAYRPLLHNCIQWRIRGTTFWIRKCVNYRIFSAMQMHFQKVDNARSEWLLFSASLRSREREAESRGRKIKLYSLSILTTSCFPWIPAA